MNRHLPYQPNLAYTNDKGELEVKHNSGFVVQSDYVKS